MFAVMTDGDDAISELLELHIALLSDQIVQRGTYAIFLRSPVDSLADADSEALVADSLVQARLDRLAPLIRHMSSHLRCYWLELKLHVLSGNLHAAIIFGLTSQGRTGQYSLATSRLRPLLSVIWLLSGGLADLEWCDAQVEWRLFVAKKLVSEATKGSCRLIVDHYTFVLFVSSGEVC